MEKDRAVEKVRKLLALANDSAASEGETANAMAQAHKLMQKHRIAEIELDTESQDDGFEILDQPLAFMGKKHTGWKTSLAQAMARHNGCYIWLQGNHIHVAGRPEDAEIARAMYKFVAHQIMAMAKGHGGRGAKWLRAWRVGVVLTVDRRLRDITRELAKEVSSTALVVVEQRAEKVSAFVHERMSFGRTRGSRTGYDNDGFEHGMRDGHNVRIHSELETD